MAAASQNQTSGTKSLFHRIGGAGAVEAAEIALSVSQEVLDQ